MTPKEKILPFFFRGRRIKERLENLRYFHRLCRKVTWWVDTSVVRVMYVNVRSLCTHTVSSSSNADKKHHEAIKDVSLEDKIYTLTVAFLTIYHRKKQQRHINGKKKKKCLIAIKAMR